MDFHMPIKDDFKVARSLRDKQQAGILELSHTELVAVSAITQNQFQDHVNETQDIYV